MNVLRPRRWLAGLAAPTAVVLVVLFGAWFGPRGRPQVRDVRELQAWAEARGLYCRSDREDGRVTSSLALSTAPLTWEEAGRCCPDALGARADAKGVAWAVNRTDMLNAMPAPPWLGECRAWGLVLITGDPELLDRLERGE